MEFTSINSRLSARQLLCCNLSIMPHVAQLDGIPDSMITIQTAEDAEMFNTLLSMTNGGGNNGSRDIFEQMSNDEKMLNFCLRYSNIVWLIIRVIHNALLLLMKSDHYTREQVTSSLPYYTKIMSACLDKYGQYPNFIKYVNQYFVMIKIYNDEL